MKIIVVGCGRMGTELILTLSKRGHEVVAVDTNPDAFTGISHIPHQIGVGFDRVVLENSGIASCDAVVACTNSDEVNAVVARVAKEFYQVPQVIARLYSSRKATIYDVLGIHTISTTTWGTQKALKMLEFKEMESIATVGNSEVEIIKVKAPSLLEGKALHTLETHGVRVVSIVRNNRAFIPHQNTEIHQEDLLFVAVDREHMNYLNDVMGL